uniref:MARVEL domain-containing protein n=1 Tax=Rhabditophanes sp. KR3021 TaxID=114890 RepID=A0AC35UHP3_9BILA
MGTSHTLSMISFAIRIFVLILCITSMILIMVAPGVCFRRVINGQSASQEICPANNALFPMNIDRWNSAMHFQFKGQNVWGQLAIIILAIIFSLPPLVFSCLYVTSRKNFLIPQIALLGFCIIAFVVLGAVETWYATGFDHMGPFIRQIGNGIFSGCSGIGSSCETSFVVKGWAASAAFLFLSALLYLIDGVLLFLRKDTSDSQVIFQRAVPRKTF